MRLMLIHKAELQVYFEPIILSILFTPWTLRSVTFPNRMVVSPMCNYSARDGFADDFHLVTLGRYALGGAGTVFVEATAVQEHGRITHGDLGLWKDEHIAGLSRIAKFVQAQGAVAAIQLGHAGRKASMQRPWFGNSALNADDHARGEQPWPIVAPSAIAVADGWLMPQALTLDAISQLKNDFVAAALRAVEAGYQIIEFHCAHGYLLHSFLSPLSNVRTDQYGGSLENRMRLIIEIASAVRRAIPESMPLFARLSTVDDVDDGWVIEDSILLAKALKQEGVDVIDCSSGGILGSATGGSAVIPRTPRTPGFQVPWAARIRQEAQLPTMAVGLILTPAQAEEVLATAAADLVAIGREALDNPNWPQHAAQVLKDDSGYKYWPKQFGWWLNVRHGILQKLGMLKR